MLRTIWMPYPCSVQHATSGCRTRKEGKVTTPRPTSLLPRFDCVTVSARDNLNLGTADHLVGLHLERRVRDNEGPHVIAKTIGLEMTLSV